MQRAASHRPTGVRRSVFRREPEGVHGDLDGALEIPGAGRLDLVFELSLASAQLLVVGVGVGPAGENGVVVGQELHRLTGAVHHVGLHVLLRVELGFLVEIADGETRCESCLTRVAVVDASHDLQQRRLAAPFAPSTPIFAPG